MNHGRRTSDQYKYKFIYQYTNDQDHFCNSYFNLFVVFCIQFACIVIMMPVQIILQILKSKLRPIDANPFSSMVLSLGYEDCLFFADRLSMQISNRCSSFPQNVNLNII